MCNVHATVMCNSNIINLSIVSLTKSQHKLKIFQTITKGILCHQFHGIFLYLTDGQPNMIGRGRQLFVCRRAASAAPGFRISAAVAAGHLTSVATFGLLTSAAAETCAAAASSLAPAACLLTAAAAFSLLTDTCAAALGLIAAAAALGLSNAAAAVFDLDASVVAIFIAEAAFGLSAVDIGPPGLPAVLTVPGLFSNLLLSRRSINRMVAVSRASIRMWVAIITAVGQL